MRFYFDKLIVRTAELRGGLRIGPFDWDGVLVAYVFPASEIVSREVASA